MATLRRIKLNGLNTHITCTLCQGYYVEATTIIECLHTFCRTCIVRYLETSTFCPVCEVQVHKTKPLLSLREDKTLQDVVYKLVPNLYRSEMQRRTEFYQQHPEAGGDRTEQSLKEKRHFFHVDDQISLSLEFLPPAHAHAHALGLRPLRGPTLLDKNESSRREGKHDFEPEVKVPHKRYIKCQAAVQIRLLEKFIRLKYALSDAHRVDIVHGSDCLSPELTLLDVVYTYKYTEDFPLHLQYTVIAPPPNLKRKKAKIVTKISSCNNEFASDHETKKQKVEHNTLSSLNKTPSKCEAELFPIDKGEKGKSILHEVNQLHKDEHDDAMVIDETPMKEQNSCDSIQNQSDCVNSKSDFESVKASDFKKTDANSSIESLRNFVNNAPGLSEYQLDSAINTAISISDGKQSESTKMKTNCNHEPFVADSSEDPIVPTEKKFESQSSLPSIAADVPIVKQQISNSTNATPVVNSSVKSSILPNVNVQAQDSVRQPPVTNPRVVLHRPPNVGFPQANNLIRYNNIVSTPRPVDPTKPRLGRPPNAARVAAAAAGRAVPQPILPRSPATRIQFSQAKPIISSKIENRGRPKKKPLLMVKDPVINNASSGAVLNTNNQMQKCISMDVNKATNAKTNSAIVTSPEDHMINSNKLIKPPGTPNATKASSTIVNTIADSGTKTLNVFSKPSSNMISRPSSVPSKSNKSLMNKPAGSASRLSSIADILVSKQLSQLNTPKNASDNGNLPLPMSLPPASSPVNVQPILPPICAGIPFIPPVSPAMCAAAYISEYNNVTNWIKLTQTAAAFRDMNMQALANQRNSPPNKSDIKPMDLSPTNKNSLNGQNTSQSSVPPILTKPYNFLQNSVSNSLSSSQTSATEITSNRVRLNKISEKEISSVERLINPKFNNNNNISLSGNLHNPRNKNVMEKITKSNVHIPNRIDSALNNSQIKKCTSNNNGKLTMKQVQLKLNSVQAGKTFSTLLKANCDKKKYNGSTLSINNIVNSVKATNGKISSDLKAERSSPTPAIAPPRSRSDGLHSVPSPKAAQSASPNSPSIPSSTISPPTPEVTITKLPNSSVSSSVSYSVPAVSGQVKSPMGKITHTNTVSITKRSNTSIASVANKLAIRSPSASVRQIPNPSLLSQKSEVRNSKNMCVDN